MRALAPTAAGCRRQRSARMKSPAVRSSSGSVCSWRFLPKYFAACRALCSCPSDRPLLQLLEISQRRFDSPAPMQMLRSSNSAPWCSGWNCVVGMAEHLLQKVSLALHWCSLRSSQSRMLMTLDCTAKESRGRRAQSLQRFAGGLLIRNSLSRGTAGVAGAQAAHCHLPGKAFSSSVLVGPLRLGALPQPPSCFHTIALTRRSAEPGPQRSQEPNPPRKHLLALAAPVVKHCPLRSGTRYPPRVKGTVAVIPALQQLPRLKGFPLTPASTCAVSRMTLCYWNAWTSPSCKVLKFMCHSSCCTRDVLD